MSEDKQIREKIDFELEEILNIKDKNNKDIIDKIDKFLYKYKDYVEINYAIVDLIKVNPKEILHLIQKHKITLNLMPFLSLITEIKFYN
ncbi:MAG: hypothetical protein N2445_09490, partial [Acidobacteria bacterium]|nr:hypothetical protein [Acidobacteriota bacterium]